MNLVLPADDCSWQGEVTRLPGLARSRWGTRGQQRRQPARQLRALEQGLVPNRYPTGTHLPRQESSTGPGRG